VRRRLISSNSEPDLITIPLFFVADPDLSTGLISIATNGEPLPHTGKLEQKYLIMSDAERGELQIIGANGGKNSHSYFESKLRGLNPVTNEGIFFG